MNWKPVTEVAYDPNPAANDGIPFVLTPSERSLCDLYSMQAGKARDKANGDELERRRKAKARALQRALDDFDGPEAA